jgi:SAM-dependent methyltransferase
VCLSGARRSETRTSAQLRQHYEVERELADRLRWAAREERLGLYQSVYDELFRRVPDHPQLSERDATQRSRSVDKQLGLLKPYLRGAETFLEIGAGDCALSRAVSRVVPKVYAVDVSREIARIRGLPSNVDFRASDGTSVPVPERGVDVAFSYQLMEHLHPADAAEQLGNVLRALRPGGAYVCVTPNRLSGPHDISQYFDDSATGFHLREYTVKELHALFSSAGFAAVDAIVGGHGRYARVPILPVELAERAAARLPRSLRRASQARILMGGVLGARVVGWKSRAA